MAAANYIFAPSAPRPTYFNALGVLAHLCLQRIEDKLDRNDPSVCEYTEQINILSYDSMYIRYTAFAKFLKKYAEKLKSDPLYPQIRDQILSIEFADGKDGDLILIYKSVLAYYFLPRDDRVIEDDWIMMTMLMTTEVALFLIEKKKDSLAVNITTMTGLLLCPPWYTDTRPFAVENWVFRDWMINSAEVIDPNRTPNMITDKDLLIENQLIFQENKIGTVGQPVMTHPSKWRTKFASNAEPETPKSFKPTGNTTALQNRLVIHTFLCGRLDPRISKSDQKTYVGMRDRHYDQKYIWKIMDLLADKISTELAYQNTEKKIMEEYYKATEPGGRQRALGDGINAYIIDNDVNYTFEQVIAASLVLSRATNELILNGGLQEAMELFEKIFYSIYTVKKTLKNRWNSFVGNVKETIDKAFTKPMPYLKDFDLGQQCYAPDPAFEDAPPPKVRKTIASTETTETKIILKPDTKPLKLVKTKNTWTIASGKTNIPCASKKKNPPSTITLLAAKKAKTEIKLSKNTEKKENDFLDPFLDFEMKSTIDTNMDNSFSLLPYTAEQCNQQSGLLEDEFDFAAVMNPPSAAGVGLDQTYLPYNPTERDKQQDFVLLDEWNMNLDDLFEED